MRNSAAPQPLGDEGDACLSKNRRHIHVFYKGKRHQHSVARIRIEKNGEKTISINIEK